MTPFQFLIRSNPCRFGRRSFSLGAASDRSSIGQPLRRAGLFVAAVVAFAVHVTDARSQEAERRHRESVALDVDSQLVRKLATVRDHAGEGQWEPAIDILHEVVATHSGTLIPAEPGRYVDAADHARRMLAALPPEGLAAYRARFDAQAGLWLEAGRRTRAPEPLERIVRQAYVSSHGDEALWLLGELAWQRGDIAAARRHWSQLVPLSRPVPVGEAAPLPVHPDSSIDPALVLARLVLCSVMERDHARAALEIAAFAKAHPEREGTLAGRTGNLAKILADVANEARGWNVRTADEAASTFAGDARRNGKTPESVDVGAIDWTRPLTSPALPTATPAPALPANGPPVHHPVVWRDVALVPEANRILAWNARTGRPWPDESRDDATLYPATPEPAPLPDNPVLGVPAFTATIDDGRLFARMGTPVVSEARNELRRPARSLVCLDLERGEGKLSWKITPEEAAGEDADWAFEGSPVVSDGRCYVTLRRSRPETQIRIVRLDAETGRTVWSRKIASAVSPVGESRNLAGHLLLALDGDTLYHATHLGAIVAIDAENGRLRWAVTYESRAPGMPEEPGDAGHRGVAPCVVDGELVFAAPADSRSVFAIHAATGIVVWERELQDDVRHLLGTGGGNLIVSGRSLWGLDARSGAIAWGRPEADPLESGYGRGLLVGDAVWWPTRETIEVVSQRTGRRLREPIRLRAKGAGGGHLLIAAGRLLIVQPNRLIAFGAGAGSAPAREEEPVALFRRSPAARSTAKPWVE